MIRCLKSSHADILSSFVSFVEFMYCFILAFFIFYFFFVLFLFFAFFIYLFILQCHPFHVFLEGVVYRNHRYVFICFVMGANNAKVGPKLIALCQKVWVTKIVISTSIQKKIIMAYVDYWRGFKRKLVTSGMCWHA